MIKLLLLLCIVLLKINLLYCDLVHLMESDAHCHLDSMKLVLVHIWNKKENSYSSTHAYIFENIVCQMSATFWCVGTRSVRDQWVNPLLSLSISLVSKSMFLSTLMGTLGHWKGYLFQMECMIYTFDNFSLGRSHPLFFLFLPTIDSPVHKLCPNLAEAFHYIFHVLSYNCTYIDKPLIPCIFLIWHFFSCNMLFSVMAIPMCVINFNSDDNG